MSFKDFWEELSFNAQVAFIGVVVFAILVVGGLVVWQVAAPWSAEIRRDTYERGGAFIEGGNRALSEYCTGYYGADTESEKAIYADLIEDQAEKLGDDNLLTDSVRECVTEIRAQ